MLIPLIKRPPKHKNILISNTKPFSILTLQIQMKLEEVEAITAKRFNQTYKRIEYKLKWKNYSGKQPIWETRSNLNPISNIVEEFDGGKIPDFHQLDSAGPTHSEHSFEDQPQNSIVYVEKRKRGRPPKKSKNGPLSVEKPKQTIPQVPVQKKPAKRGRPRKSQQKIDEEQLSQDKSYKEDDNENERKSMRMRSRLNIPPITRQKFEEEENFTVLMGNYCGEVFTFLVQDNNVRKQMSRQDLYRDHPRALVDFYQKHLRIEFPDEQADRIPVTHTTKHRYTRK